MRVIFPLESFIVFLGYLTVPVADINAVSVYAASVHLGHRP